MIESGACTRPQLFEGLRKAAEMVSSGAYRPIGEMLVSLGYVTQEQLDAALEQQSSEEAEETA